VREKDRIGTIVRAYGEFRYKSQLINVAIGGRFGLGIVSDDALAVGAVPDPVGDSDFPWYWNQSFFYDRPNSETLRIAFDIKGKRRLNSSKTTLAWVLDNDAIISGANMEYAFGLRLLFTWK